MDKKLLYTEGETLIFVRLLAQKQIPVAIWQPWLSEGELEVNEEGLRRMQPGAQSPDR